MNTTRLQLFTQLYQEIKNATSRAINFYLEEAGRLGLAGQYHTWFQGIIMRIDSDYIVIRWDDYRQDYDVGNDRFNLPWEALSDDTYKSYITNLVTKQVEAHAAREANQLARLLATKQALYKQLKAELDE